MHRAIRVLQYSCPTTRAGGATVDAGCGVTSRTEGRPRSVPSLVQPRRQSPRRPARGQTRIAACLATPPAPRTRTRHAPKGSPGRLRSFCGINARGAPRPTGGKCRGKQERIDNAYTIKMSRFSEYGLFHVISSTKSVHSCRKLFHDSQFARPLRRTAHIVRCAAKRLVFRHLRDVEVPISPRLPKSAAIISRFSSAMSFIFVCFCLFISYGGRSDLCVCLLCCGCVALRFFWQGGREQGDTKKDPPK